MRKVIEIPEMWEEIKPADFAYLLKLVFEAEPDKITVGDMLMKFSHYLLGSAQPLNPTRRTQYFNLVRDVAGKLDWIFSLSEDGNYELDFNTTENLLPELSGYKGPQSHGNDLLFGEYRIAVDLMNRYTTEKDVFFLNALCGVLYRRPSAAVDSIEFDGQYREKFNKHHIERYAQNMEPVPVYLKWGVYVWFAYFNRYLIEGGEFIIDGNTVSFESLFGREPKDGDAQQGINIGLNSIVFTLADSGTFGNAEQTDNTQLFQVFLKLLHDKNAADRLKKHDRN